MFYVLGRVLVAWPAPIVSAEQYQKYGIQYNIKRKQLGLPVLPNDWVFELNGGCWADKVTLVESKMIDGFRVKPYAYKSTARHTRKSLVIENGTLVSERDYYCSGNSFKSEDPDAVNSVHLCPESLMIRYIYPTTDDTAGTWDCSHSRGDPGLSFEEAKKILKSWGLSHSYPAVQ